MKIALLVFRSSAAPVQTKYLSIQAGKRGSSEGTGGVEPIKMMFLVWISRNFPLQLFYPQCCISVSS